MKKAILLDVRLWIEGEDEPAHDWAAAATAAVKAIIADGAAKHPGMKVTVRSVKERKG